MCTIKEQGVAKGCVQHHVIMDRLRLRELQMTNRWKNQQNLAQLLLVKLFPIMAQSQKSNFQI